MISMSTNIKFDRDIDAEKHYISLGGYCIDFKDKSIQFDFTDSIGSIDTDNKSILHVEQYNLDELAFPESKDLVEELLKPDNIQEVSDFYVYTGEPEEDEQIIPVKVMSVVFGIDKDDKYSQVEIPSEILNNIKL